MRISCSQRHAHGFAWALLGCACVLLACSSSRVAPAALEGADRLVVAPLNLAVKLPVELEDGAQPVRDAIIAYLQQRDARVAVIWPSDCWKNCVTPNLAASANASASVSACVRASL